MNSSENSDINQKKKRHITECPRGDNLTRFGDKAEKAVYQYILDNLTIRAIGDYRILLNYHMPVRSPGPAATQEIDLVLINKFGVFLIEVKDWAGKIIASDDTWVKDDRDMKGNPLLSIESKARIFKSHWFGKSSNFGDINVWGLVVLARGKANFENRSNYDDRSIVGIDQALLNIINPPTFLLKPDYRKLADDEIEQIKNTLFKKHIDSGEILIEDYRIGNHLLPGDLYHAYEAVNKNLPTQHVRIKVYQLKDLIKVSDDTQRKIRRDADAVSKMGIHSNIIYTLNFFPDPTRSDLYYEVTELIDGVRLDKLMARTSECIPYKIQLDYLIQLCKALTHAHKKEIYHRNICPETVYITRDGVVKLADFDFAKVIGDVTISDPKQPLLINNKFAPPELFSDPTSASADSDLYSLGCLWLYLAYWPVKNDLNNPQQDTINLSIPQPARELMRSMLSTKRAHRPQNAENLRKKLQDLS